MQMVRDATKAVHLLLEQRKNSEAWLLAFADNPNAMTLEGYTADETKQYLQQVLRDIDAALEGLVQPPQVDPGTPNDEREDYRSHGRTNARQRDFSRRDRRPDRD